MQQPPAPKAGVFLAADAIPETLLPVLRRMMREQLPVLLDTARRLSRWLDAHPSEPIPRALGLHEYVLEGQQGQRIVRPYALWMLQRARDWYRQLKGSEREAADRLLRAVDGAVFANFSDPPRLARDGLSVRLA